MIQSLVVLLPQVVPPSPTKCLTEARTVRGWPRSGAAVYVLQALELGHAQSGDQICILAEALKGAAPADVVGYGDRRRKNPVNAGGQGLESRDLADALHKGRIPAGSQADVVGKDHGPPDVAVTVHRIGAIEQGDAQAGLEGRFLIAAHHCRPVLRCIRFGVAAAAAQNRTDGVLGNLGGRDAAVLHLGHLADLFGQGHAGQQIPYPFDDRRLGVLVRVLFLHGHPGGSPSPRPLPPSLAARGTGFGVTRRRKR